MDSCLIVRDKHNKKGFIKANNSWALRKDISSVLKDILINIFGRTNMPNNTILNWNQKTIMSVLDLGRYEVERAVKEAVKYGFCTVVAYYPHKKEDDEDDIILNNRIQFKYYWYESPELNPKFNKGDAQLISTENNVEEIKDFIENTPEIQKSIETNTPIVVEGELEDNPYYQLALEEWKSSYYMDYFNGKDLFIGTDDNIKEYIRAFMTTDDDINKIAEGCWNVIVKAKTYNNNAFNKYRYSTAGCKMAAINEKAIIQAFNTFSTYQKGCSNIEAINIDAKEAKRFIIHSTMIIYNYTKFGFLDGNLPEYKDLLGLYKTIADHPELLCLKNDEESYKILDYLFKKNQEQYNRKT